MLLILPWTGYWDHNYFVNVSRDLQPSLASPWLRGAVSGIGLVTFFAGLADLLALLVRRSRSESPTASLGSAARSDLTPAEAAREDGRNLPEATVDRNA